MKKLLLFFTLLLALFSPCLAAEQSYTFTYDKNSVTCSTSVPGTLKHSSDSFSWHLDGTSTSGNTLGIQKDGTVGGFKFGTSTSNPFKEGVVYVTSEDDAKAPFLGQYVSKATLKACKDSNAKDAKIGIKVDGILIQELDLTTTTATEFTFIIDKVVNNTLEFTASQSETTLKKTCSVNLGSFSITFGQDDPVDPIDYDLAIPNFPAELTVDEEFDLSTLEIPADAPALTWSSADENVAAVIDNILMAGDPGETTITASWDATTQYNEGHKDFILTVKEKELVTFAHGWPATLNLTEGDEYAFAIPDKAPANIEWTSTNDDVVLVMDGELVAGSTPGTATVSARWEADADFLAGDFACEVTVTAIPLPGIPAVTINGTKVNLSVEHTSYYNVARGATATVSADNAATLNIYNDNHPDGGITIEGATGSFAIEYEGEYIIEALNSKNQESESLNFYVTLVDPVAGEPTPEVWKLITSADDLTEDGEYVFASDSKIMGNKARNSSDNNREALDVTITTVDGQKVIEELPAEDDAIRALIFTIEKAILDGNDGYYWKTDNYAGGETKYLNSTTESKNYLKMGTKGDISFTTVAFSGTNAVVTYTKCSNRKIYYNADTNTGNLFASYTSTSNQPVQLYKKFGGAPAEEITVEEYLEEISDREGARLSYSYDENAKLFRFTSTNPDVKFEHKTAKNSAASPAPARKAVEEDGWQLLENGEYSHTDVTDTNLWVRAVKGEGENKIASPVFWRYLTAEGTPTGIEGVDAEDAEITATYYNLQGAAVDPATAPAGIYLERRGAKVAKVVIR